MLWKIVNCKIVCKIVSENVRLFQNNTMNLYSEIYIRIMNCYELLKQKKANCQNWHKFIWILYNRIGTN